MGQKVNPISLRVGDIRKWASNWFASKKDFVDNLMEDEHIRKYLQARMTSASVAQILIERTIQRIMITIYTARPGMVIGKGGTEVSKISEELKKLTGKEIQLNIFEVKKPELAAQLVAKSIAQQFKARISYRRAMKQAIISAMRSGARGIKIKVAGRLGGVEIAKSEKYKRRKNAFANLACRN